MKNVAISTTETIKGFIKRWLNRGSEKKDTQIFWLELLKIILGSDLPSEFIEFEKSVYLDHESFIDAYIPSTRVLIEQKSKGKSLDKAIKQSDGNMMKPYEQAKRYSDWLPLSEHARWIVICNFQEFWVYDMEHPKGTPEVIQLKNLEDEWLKLRFLIEANEDEKIEDGQSDFILDNAFYVKVVTLHFAERSKGSWVSPLTGHRSPFPNKIVIKVRLDELFKYISLRLMGKHGLRGFVDAISSYQKGYDVDMQDALSVKNKYEQLGLIRDTSNGKTSVIELTALGRKIMNELNPI